MIKTRITALIILIAGAFVGYFVFASEHSYVFHKPVPAWIQSHSFKLGLDLSGGTHLVYRADVSKIAATEVKDSMSALRDVIERRVNTFGVSEPSVTIQEGGIADEERLIIDLPGVTDVEKAVEAIGQTPLLEFKTENPNPDAVAPVEATVGPDGNIVLPPIDPYANMYVSTPLTGSLLEHATVEFNPSTGEPIVGLQFNKEGSDLFEKITGENVGKTIAIFLDGSPISAPVVNEAISGGKAQISGSFTPEEAKTLVGRLNSGALPVPITLISTQTIGASLGETAVHAGIYAGVIGFLAIIIFLLIWYRLPGLFASVALIIYAAIMLALFKLIPVTLTAAGIAGFIISIGIAVDANVLIFERVKEELKNGRTVGDALHMGFARAWTSIRDSNTSTIITAIILFWFGTSLIKGFALVLGLGVLVSMFSAITISRIFLYSLNIRRENKFVRFLFSAGLSTGKHTT